MKIGDKVFVRDGWITEPYMVPAGEIIYIGYEKNTEFGIIFLLAFKGTFKTHWFHRISLKTE